MRMHHDAGSGGEGRRVSVPGSTGSQHPNSKFQFHSTQRADFDLCMMHRAILASRDARCTASLINVDVDVVPGIPASLASQRERRTCRSELGAVTSCAEPGWTVGDLALAAVIEGKALEYVAITTKELETWTEVDWKIGCDAIAADGCGRSTVIYPGMDDDDMQSSRTCRAVCRPTLSCTGELEMGQTQHGRARPFEHRTSRQLVLAAVLKRGRKDQYPQSH